MWGPHPTANFRPHCLTFTSKIPPEENNILHPGLGQQQSWTLCPRKCQKHFILLLWALSDHQGGQKGEHKAGTEEPCWPLQRGDTQAFPKLPQGAWLAAASFWHQLTRCLTHLSCNTPVCSSLNWRWHVLMEELWRCASSETPNC